MGGPLKTMGEKRLLEFRFRAVPENLPILREKVGTVAQQIGWDRKAVSDAVIAVNEACVNVMQHAYQGDRSGQIILEILDNGDDLVFCLTDFADRVDLRQIGPRALDDLRPGGLGTYFMHQIMDECVYGHLAGHSGNTLRMARKLVRVEGNSDGLQGPLS